MPLPTPNLDDLRFQQDLVDEARRRIIRYCPEWTDYNLSDPGITLIELFAWMTEMLTYRLNRVPEKNYIKFMELLGIQLQPANSARAELTFRLSTPFPINPEDQTSAIVPQGTEVATRAAPGENEVTFTTDEPLVISPPRLTQVRREENFVKNYLPRLGVETFYAFGHPRPREGDTFYLGFDESREISGHILRLEFEAEETQATGVRRTDPPLVWECSTGNGQWSEVIPRNTPGERDTTGGLNNPRGAITFYLPLSISPDQVRGRSASWLRCRLEQRRPEQGMYSRSPRITSIRAFTLGSTGRATHAVVVKEETLGRSNGDPGQTFHTQNAPILSLREGETIEVEENRDGEIVWAPWTRVEDFSQSDRFERHYVLDSATGEVSFGPCIRQPDGTMRQYGRVLEAGRLIQFGQYRYGGGVAGNVPTGRIEVLKSAIPYVDRVTNLQRADGGRDPESLEEAQMRARREIRSQQRAVTSEDYESLTRDFSRAIARARCRPPGKDSTLSPGTLELLIVPAAFDSVRVGDLTRLHLDEALAKSIESHLDKYRLLTTSLFIRAPRYLGIKIKAEIVISEFSQPEVVRNRVAQSLASFISPLDIVPGEQQVNDVIGPGWEGWPFGRSLFVSEVYSSIQKVPGVKHVLSVSLGHRPVIPAREEAIQDTSEENGEAGDTNERQTAEREDATLEPVDGNRIDIPPDTLLCSLEHQVEIVEL